jgi:hypothetical protein
MIPLWPCGGGSKVDGFSPSRVQVPEKSGTAAACAPLLSGGRGAGQVSALITAVEAITAAAVINPVERMETLPTRTSR